MRFTTLLFAALQLSSASFARSINAELGKSPKAQATEKYHTFLVRTQSDYIAFSAAVAKYNLDVWGGLGYGQLKVRVPVGVDTTELFQQLFTKPLDQDFEAVYDEEKESGKRCKSEKFYDKYETDANYGARLGWLGLKRTVQGYTAGKRPISWYKFGHGPTHVMLVGGVNAQDWASPYMMTYVAEKLYLANIFADLRKAFTFHVAPLVNPDGYMHSSEIDASWAKNRELTKQDQLTCLGTNVNHNFGFMWKEGSSRWNKECTVNYAGSEEFSAAESRAVRDYVEALKAKGIIPSIVMDVHPTGQLLYTPFGYSCASFQQLQEKVAALDPKKPQVDPTFFKLPASGPKDGTCDASVPGFGDLTNWLRNAYGVPYAFSLGLDQLKVPKTNSRKKEDFEVVKAARPEIVKVVSQALGVVLNLHSGKPPAPLTAAQLNAVLVPRSQ